jgi:DNA-directed RNA polymerase subunit alpha
VQDLTQRTQEDMLKVRNLGQKSLDEVVKKLHDLGLNFRSKDE